MAEIKKELSLTDIFRIVWKNKIIIAILFALGFIAAFIKTQYFTNETYTASGILYVSNRNDISADEDILAADIVTSRTLTTTYIEILKTPSFLKKVSEGASENLNGRTPHASINIEVVGETELLRVTVTANSKEEAYEVANSLFGQAPEKLKSVYKRGEVETVDPPVIPTSANSKGLVTNVMLGALIGLFLGVVIALVRSFFDTRVHLAEDVEKRYGLSVLGEIAD